MVIKIIKKYKEVSIEIKAAAWYTVSNIVQKIAPWLVMVILTHYLATEDYGVYTVFMSWLEIFEIIITLRIYSSGYVAGLVRNDENKKVYTATMQSLSMVLIVIWFSIYILFHKSLNKVTGIDTKLSVLMFFSFFSTIGFGLWSSRQRVNNQYKKMLMATILYGLVGPIIGALTVFLNFKNPIFYVIAVRTGIQLFIAVPFIISNYRGTTIKWNRNFAIDALRYNFPLLPYYLSMVLLSHSDRLMIQKIIGYADAAIYSVAYSASMMVFVISGALNLSLQAWLFKELKKNDNCKNKSKLISMGTLIMSFFSIAEIVLAPELITILGGPKYLEAIWVMPPIVINVIVMYIYQQYVNVLFYFKQTKMILVASVFSAICNIVLNAIFIPRYGYIAAGYTSMASYMLVMCLYLFTAKQTCDIEGIHMQDYFDTPLQMTILLISIVIAFLMLFLYTRTFLRYMLVLVMVTVLVCTRKRWILLLKKGEID